MAGGIPSARDVDRPRRVCGVLIASAAVGCGGGSSEDAGASAVRGGIIASQLPQEPPVAVAVRWERYRDGVQGEIARRYIEKSCAGIDEAVSQAVKDAEARGVREHTAMRTYAGTLKQRLRCA